MTEVAMDQFLRSVFNEINDAVLIYDVETLDLVEYNRKVCDLFGCIDNSILESTLTDYFTTEEPYTADRLREYANNAVLNGHQFIEWKAKNKHGHHFWVELNLKHMIFEGQRFLVVIMRNISLLKQANEDLKNSEERFRELAESLPEVVFEIDIHANLTFCNKAAFDFFGATIEILIWELMSWII